MSVLFRDGDNHFDSISPHFNSPRYHFLPPLLVFTLYRTSIFPLCRYSQDQ